MGSAYAEKYAVLTNVESSISTWLNRSKIKAIDFRKISCEAIQKKAFFAEGNPKTNPRKRCHRKVAPFLLSGILRIIRIPPCS